MNPEETHFELIVIGSGPAGRRAAVQAAKARKTVLVVEKGQRVGGVSVHTGTIPSKTLRETVLNLSGWRERGFYGQSWRAKNNITADDLLDRLHKTLNHEVEILEHQFARNQVKTFCGQAAFISPNAIEVVDEHLSITHFTADRFIICVGTRPWRPDYIPFDGVNVLDSDEILGLKTLPHSLTVIGAGVIGTEYATIFSALDVSVTLVDPGREILPFVDRELIDEFVHELRDRGIQMRLGCAVDKVEVTEGGQVLTTLANKRSIRTDMALYAAGRTGSTDDLGLENCGLEAIERGKISVDQKSFQTSVPHIYAVGDVIGFPSLASTSMEQGRIAACHAFGIEAHEPPAFFPYGIYAVPEISTIGMTEEEVVERNIPYECGIARFRETSRGHIMGLKSGFLKMIFSLESRRLLGVHIVGEGATELIHIGQAVLNLKGTLEYFVENTFNYPTLAEGYKIAALDAWNRMPREQPSAAPLKNLQDELESKKAAG